MAVRFSEKDDRGAATLVEDLQTAELLLVAALRLYAAQCGGPAAGQPDWRDRFCAAGIDECGVPRLQRAVQDHRGRCDAPARRPLSWCRFLGEDEARLVELEGSLQRAQTAAAEEILAMWLPAMAARMAMLPAQGLANAMTRSALFLPSRHNEPIVPHRRGSLSACVDRGLALLQ